MADFDPDAFLSGQATPQEAKPEEKKDDGFDPDAFLANQQKTPTMANGAVDANGPVAPESAASDTMPLPQFYPAAPAGYNWNAVKSTATPFVQAGKEAIVGYAKNPLAAVTDVALAHMGAPPLAGMKNAYEAYQTAKEAVANATKTSSKFPQAADLNTEYHPLRNAIAAENPEAAGAMSQAFRASGPQGVKNWLAGPGKEYLSNPATKDLAESLIGKVPGVGTQVMRAASPVLSTMGKVLGPAGMALNAYQAGQVAQENQLGPRLAQGQGGTAQHQFKQMNPGYSQQFNQQITPDQAHLILNSNNERDIAAFGGREALTNIAQTPARQILAQPPTSQNFMQRMQALGYLYHSATQGK